ncbi:hypothetical protein [Phytohalomonas tamaricis]|uniref:hypothetical protein n=1 Tax=Phytohalomonas tamaricis TaxID=2081032 RepID=UPI0021D3FF40|nr:hypothetical protein [Phytohalomonas tamaricis]
MVLDIVFLLRFDAFQICVFWTIKTITNMTMREEKMSRVADLIHINAAEDYSSLEPLLRSWTEAVMSYCKMHDFVDNCWWYNERASLSVLAGAAWRAKGWLALEEFSTGKRGERVEGVDSGSIRNGRCDLYITNQDESFAFEAKQAWQPIGNKTTGDLDVNRALAKAWQDVGELHNYEADTRIAATFIVPSIPISQASEDGEIQPRKVREAVNSWLESMAGFERLAGKQTAYAYVFPANCEHYFNEDIGRVFPGTVLVLEKRLRGAYRKG